MPCYTKTIRVKNAAERQQAHNKPPFTPVWSTGVFSCPVLGLEEAPESLRPGQPEALSCDKTVMVRLIY